MRLFDLGHTGINSKFWKNAEVIDVQGSINCHYGFKIPQNSIFLKCLYLVGYTGWAVSRAPKHLRQF